VVLAALSCPTQPTSGLDSYTSNEVMTVVKHLVEDGTTICATIVGENAARPCSKEDEIAIWPLALNIKLH
jgi:ABC-type ATPase involved in cell division